MSLEEPNYKALFIQAEIERDRVTRQYQRLLAASDEQLIYISDLKDEIEKWKRAESVACDKMLELCKEIDRLKADNEWLKGKNRVDELGTLAPSNLVKHWMNEAKRLKADLTNCQSEADRLKVENERLKKAGDAMALRLMDGGVILSGHLLAEDWFKSKWNDAKEGKDL